MAIEMVRELIMAKTPQVIQGQKVYKLSDWCFTKVWVDGTYRGRFLEMRPMLNSSDFVKTNRKLMDSASMDDLRFAGVRQDDLFIKGSKERFESGYYAG